MTGVYVCIGLLILADLCLALAGFWIQKECRKVREESEKDAEEIRQSLGEISALLEDADLTDDQDFERRLQAGMDSIANYSMDVAMRGKGDLV